MGKIYHELPNLLMVYNYVFIYIYNFQILKFIAPKVRYRPPGSKKLRAGISINLRGLLAASDSYGIDHPTEKLIRHHVRQSPSTISCGNQRFLPDDFPVTRDVLEIPRQNFSLSKACITLPVDIIPEEFFNCLYGSECKIMM